MHTLTHANEQGMGMEFLGSDSKAIIKSSIAICQDNFPEMLYKSHMVKPNNN